MIQVTIAYKSLLTEDLTRYETKLHKQKELQGTRTKCRALFFSELVSISYEVHNLLLPSLYMC